MRARLSMLVATIAIAAGTPLAAIAWAGPAGASPPTPTCSVTTDLSTTSSVNPHNSSYTVADLFIISEDSEELLATSGTSLSITCAGITSQEVDYIEPYGGGYLYVWVQDADAYYGPGPTFAPLPSSFTASLDSVASANENDTIPSQPSEIAGIWGATLADLASQGPWGPSSPQSLGVNEWSDDYSTMTYTNGAYATPPSSTYDPTSPLTGLASSTTSSAAPILTASALALIPLLIIFLVTKKYLFAKIFGRRIP